MTGPECRTMAINGMAAVVDGGVLVQARAGGRMDLPIAMTGARWPGWSAERTLVLPVPASLWAPPPEEITLYGVAFKPKPELHVTLVGGDLGAELHAALGEDRFADASKAAFHALDWSFVRRGRRMMLRKHGLVEEERKEFRSLIELVQMPAMARFHFALGKLLGRELAVPPPHVTLFTAGRDKGIGLANRRQLRVYSVRELADAELRASG
jgi:hypothetical protein